MAPLVLRITMQLLKNKVFKNASWIIGCKIVQAVLALIVTMLMSRYMGPSNYGVISYAASMVAFVVPVMQLGFRNTLVQEFVNSPDEEGKILGTALGMNVVASFACIVGIISFVSIANRGETVTIVVCGIYSINLIFQALEMAQYWFQAKLISKYTSVSMLIGYIAISAFQFYLMGTGKSIYWFAVAASVDYVVIAILLLTIYRKKGGQPLSFSWQKGKEMFAKSRYYIIANLMVTIFAQTDRIMLNLMTDDAMVGYYAAAITCANMTSFVFYAIIDSARPSIFESHKHDKSAFEKKVSLLYTVIIYLSLIQCIVITVCAPLIVWILYGKEFSPAVGVLQLLVWYTTFSHLGSIRNIWILAENVYKKLWLINLSGAVLNVILNYLLIPLYAASGAAFASLVTQIFTNVALCFIMKSMRRCGVLMIKGLDFRPLLRLVKGKKG